jgi:prophage regulatory protein
MPQAILRLPAVKARTGLSRSTIYLRLAEGTFPKPIALGARAVGWLQSDIDDWISAQVERSRKRAASPSEGRSHA